MPPQMILTLSMAFLTAQGIYELPEPFPPLEDLTRFPPAFVVDQQIRAGQRELQALTALSRSVKWWDPVIDGQLLPETRQRLFWWQTLREAQDPHNEVKRRRQCLATLRYLLPTELYQAGAIPPSIRSGEP